MIRITLAALLLIALQQSSQQPSTIDTLHLSIKVSNPPRAVTPGARVSLHVEVTPKPKMHVYAPDQPDYIPISLALPKSDEYVPHPAVFPKAEALYFKPLDETQLVYSKPFRIVQDVTIARTPALRRLARTPAGSITIAGTLRYQACDDSLCYPPRNVPVVWTVSLVKL